MDAEFRRRFMRLAVDEALKSPEGQPRVGVVIARNLEVLCSGSRGEMPGGLHAEQVALKKANDQGISLHGATAFTTLEPCSNSRTGRVPCADLLAGAGVSDVYIGRYDINPQVYRLGWRALVDNGIHCWDFDADFRDELELITARFEGFFLRRNGLEGVAKFDHTQNGGQYVFSVDESIDSPCWNTRWGTCGADSVYANAGHPGVVALARYARKFDEIDDPDALDYGSHFAKVGIGDIAVFRNNTGHVLCQVLDVEPTVDYGGGPHVSVKIAYQIRLRN
ncbi:hypothetical protein JIG36_48635 [Actinoplanes sp. LDG1-06]|uniref:CMP/dCMP-type deaminase domain-containing protein n=1 Tax=Paractinoplanes ovalisporus TaxID=2810368 RepID=A0ABS2AW46_9ACTN|nr:hypothetical protein [Actinoplanes ovalisporus]MBM2623389.1 hypothetical protein [Actinoplanes ovalisporus]